MTFAPAQGKKNDKVTMMPSIFIRGVTKHPAELVHPVAHKLFDGIPD
jgi:hypothetical protein